MPCLSLPLRGQAVFMFQNGSSVREVLEYLRRGGTVVSRQTVWQLLHHYRRHRQCASLPRPGRPAKTTPRKLSMIEMCMQENDETTGKELVKKVFEDTVVKLSLKSVYRSRRKLGWSYRGVRVVNKQKRLEWAQKYSGDDFEDVIWTDETSVQLETHRCFCCCKNGQKPRNKPRPKHPVKVHVWAGNGATQVCVFDGIMDAEKYTHILETTLVPFIDASYHQDIDLCRTMILNTHPAVPKLF